jgi:hypothetical protein
VNQSIVCGDAYLASVEEFGSDNLLGGIFEVCSFIDYDGAFSSKLKNTRN